MQCIAALASTPELSMATAAAVQEVYASPTQRQGWQFLCDAVRDWADSARALDSATDMSQYAQAAMQCRELLDVDID